MTFLDPRLTERRNPRTADIDLASPVEIVDLINREDAGIAPAVATQRLEIARAIELAEAAFRAGGRLIYVGAGTSGRLGVLDASEMPPTFGTEPGMVQGIIAGGSRALTTSVEGAEDDPAAAVTAINDAGVSAHDVVVGIAASGTTPFVGAALERARSLGASTVLVACSPPPDSIARHADVRIVVPTGPEVVTGSTRMKAGTATKMVLNTISTGAMIRLGKTYGNLMIDQRLANAKLRDRAERILMEVCDVSRDDARALLVRSDGSVKTAAVMQMLGLSLVDARERLSAAGGVVRRAVGRTPPPVTASDAP